MERADRQVHHHDHAEMDRVDAERSGNRGKQWRQHDQRGGWVKEAADEQQEQR